MTARPLLLARLIRHRSALMGFVGTCLILLVAALGPRMAPYSIDGAGTVERVLDRLKPPGLLHPLGSDHMGADVLSLVLHGAGPTIKVSLGAALAGTLAGAAVGVCAGYQGGLADMIIMRLIDVVLAFPSLVLAILVAASLGPGATSITLALVLTGWAAPARVVRSAVLVLREEEYILAARAIGCSPFRVMARHLLPNCLPLIIVLFTMRLGVMILAESSLSFLGLGSPAGAPSWGVMVDTGRSYIGAAPWCSMAPATAIALTVLAFNFLGDGLRDLLDPRLRGRL